MSKARCYSVLILSVLTTCPLLLSCAKSAPDNAGTSSGPPPYVAPDPFPHLHSVAAFAVLAGSNVTNTGASVVYGNIGVSPGTAMSGIGSVKMTGGKVYSGDVVATTAQRDAVTAYGNLATSVCTQDLTGLDLGGLTLKPGTYCFSSSATVTGVLKLDSGGDSNADFVFQVEGSLTFARGSSVQLINDGTLCNAFWKVNGSASFGAGSNIIGSILAVGGITLGAGSQLNGKAIARDGAVTIDSSQIYNNTCPE